MDKTTHITNPSFISQQPIVDMMDYYMRQSSRPTHREPTMQYELANKPRYDITGDRYGNTLTDDMISIKNPREINRHTDRTIEYFANPEGHAGEGAYVKPTYTLELPNLGAYMPQNEGDRPPGRKKFVTEGGSGVVKGEDVWEFMDMPTEVQNYYDAMRLRDQQQGLSTEGARQEQFGKGIKRQDPRYDANYDEYLGTLVDYGRLSWDQLGQLAKMGVDRPIESDSDASGDLMGLINLYKWAMEQK